MPCHDGRHNMNTHPPTSPCPCHCAPCHRAHAPRHGPLHGPWWERWALVRHHSSRAVAMSHAGVCPPARQATPCSGSGGGGGTGHTPRGAGQGRATMHACSSSVSEAVQRSSSSAERQRLHASLHALMPGQQQPAQLTSPPSSKARQVARWPGVNGAASTCTPHVHARGSMALHAPLPRYRVSPGAQGCTAARPPHASAARRATAPMGPPRVRPHGCWQAAPNRPHAPSRTARRH